jgi:hypothetical protein
MVFGPCVEIGCGKTNATAAKTMKKSLAVIPIRAAWPRERTWHPEICSSVGPDTETSKEASKFSLTPTTSFERLIIIDGKDYNTRKIRGQYKVAMKNHPFQ